MWWFLIAATESICVEDFDLNESRTIDLRSRDLKANYFKDFTWQWICIYVTWQYLCTCVTWQRLCICMVVSLSYNLLQNKNKNKARHPGMCCFHGSSSITLSAELGHLSLFAPGHQSFMPLVFGSDSHQLWSWDLEVQHPGSDAVRIGVSHATRILGFLPFSRHITELLSFHNYVRTKTPNSILFAIYLLFVSPNNHLFITCWSLLLWHTVTELWTKINSFSIKLLCHTPQQ